MTITELLGPRCIFLDIEVTSKKKLLELIASIVAERTDLSESSIFSSLLSRERLGSTAHPSVNMSLPTMRCCPDASAR